MNWRGDWLRFSNPFVPEALPFAPGTSLRELGVSEPVVVYRAVPSYAEDWLRHGDFVSSSSDVGHYAPHGKIITARVRPEHLRYYQRSRPGELEMVYTGPSGRGAVK